MGARDRTTILAISAAHTETPHGIGYTVDCAEMGRSGAAPLPVLAGDGLRVRTKPRVLRGGTELQEMGSISGMRCQSGMAEQGLRPLRDRLPSSGTLGMTALAWR